MHAPLVEGEATHGDHAVHGQHLGEVQRDRRETAGRQDARSSLGVLAHGRAQEDAGGGRRQGHAHFEGGDPSAERRGQALCVDGHAGRAGGCIEDRDDVHEGFAHRTPSRYSSRIDHEAAIGAVHPMPFPSLRTPIAVFGLTIGSACGGSTLLNPGGTPPADAGAPLDAAIVASDVCAPPQVAAPEPGIHDATDPGDAAPEACVDLQGDPLNCGVCGHDCQGAACVAGVCGPAPQVLASGQAPAYLAVDAENVYWINVLPQPAGAAGHSQVMRCAIDGCNDRPTLLWDGLYPVSGIAVEQGAVWWPRGPGADLPNVLSCAIGGCANMATAHLAWNENFSAFAANPRPNGS